MLEIPRLSLHTYVDIHITYIGSKPDIYLWNKKKYIHSPCFNLGDFSVITGLYAIFQPLEAERLLRAPSFLTEKSPSKWVLETWNPMPVWKLWMSICQLAATSKGMTLLPYSSCYVSTCSYRLQMPFILITNFLNLSVF